MAESSIKKLAKDYIPPKPSLKDVVREYEVEIENNHDTLNLLHSIIDVLESGVEKLTLKISDKYDRVTVNEDCFKAISCNCVKIAKIHNKGQFASKTDAKVHIETSYWNFPCPDYKYSNIKKNLEKSIYAITGCDVEVKSFLTGIVEYGEADGI